MLTNTSSGAYLSLRLKLRNFEPLNENTSYKATMSFSLTNYGDEMAKYVFAFFRFFNFNFDLVTKKSDITTNKIEDDHSGHGVEVLAPPFIEMGVPRIVLPDPQDISENDLWLINGTHLFDAVLTIEEKPKLPQTIMYQITHEHRPTIAGKIMFDQEFIQSALREKCLIITPARLEFY